MTAPAAWHPRPATAAGSRARRKDAGRSTRKVLYEGVPSWKAYLGFYVAAGFAAVIVIAVLNWMAGSGAAVGTKLLDVVIPIAVAVLFMFALNL